MATKQLSVAFFYPYLFIERAFKTTLTDENAIAPAAIEGFKSQPVKGNKMPAATGIPIML